MTDVESTLRAELLRLTPVDAVPDWSAVLDAAGARGEGAARRRLGVAVAALLAAAAVALVTPLGGAIARGLDDFATWLTGEPGTPVSEEEQRAFDEDNQRRWLGFPEGTQLRRLITRRVDDVTVELFGFRPGASRLCLRMTVSGALTERATECAPLDELRRQGGPARVLIADEGVGIGDKFAWYGIDRVSTNKLRITAGIAADDVRAVVLRDDAGRHEVPVESNAFLYVAEDPDVGQRVREVWARTPAGLVGVPFAPAPFAIGSAGAQRVAPPAPPVERDVSGGTISWLEAREERGESFESLPERVRNSRIFHPPPPPCLPSAGTSKTPPPCPPASASSPLDNLVFVRVLTPDPDRPYRAVLALYADRPGGDPAGFCHFDVELSGRGGGGGGCWPRSRGFGFGLWPFNFSGSSGGPGAFDTIHGWASDDVARLEILLADGTHMDVPLVDNAFIVDVPRSGLPGRMVAYDSQGRVISSSMTLSDLSAEPQPARGKADLLWRVEGPDGSYAKLSVGPSTHGGECLYVEQFVDEQQRGSSESCTGPQWTGPPVQVTPGWSPGRFVEGRVRDDVKTVRIRYADGETTLVKPRRGYVLYAVPAEHLAAGRLVTATDGLDASGRVVGTTSFPPPPSG